MVLQHLLVRSQCKRTAGDDRLMTGKIREALLADPPAATDNDVGDGHKRAADTYALWPA